ncbi:MAG: tRNA pseudouridine(55) synthase TruB [Gemmatimonadales bacterium]|nr:tRNA pseudouridine(55) synthase TruB [Gemmatimonadales bacterium]
MDKPAGITSHDVVATVRKRLGTRAVGHTGTLDPFATGLLVLVLGSATRLARHLEGATKTYWAEARLGFATDSDDWTGEPLGVAVTGPWPSQGQVGEVLARLTGPGEQRPPAYSAKQVGGVRSHAVARRGGRLELAAVPVTVHELTLLSYRPPLLSFRVTVSAGTYIRALARDLGMQLGTGAHLTALRRESVGRFALARATPLRDLTAEAVIPPLALIEHLPRVELAPDAVTRVRHGQRVPGGFGAGPTALVAGEQLVAIAEARDGVWQPITVFPA